MIQAQLVQRRVLAIQAIGELLDVDFEGMPKAINSEHHQLFTLERIVETLKSQSAIELKESDGEPAYPLAEILEIEGLSKTSIKVLQAVLDGSSN